MTLLIWASSASAAAKQVCLEEMLKTERDPKIQSVCDALCRPEINVKDDKINSVQKTALLPEFFLESEIAVPIYTSILQAIKKSGSMQLSQNDLGSLSASFNEAQSAKYLKLSLTRKTSKLRLEQVKAALVQLGKKELILLV